MTTRIVFADLVGRVEPDRPLTPDEDRWLADIAQHVDATNHTLRLAPSLAATEPEPVLQRQLDGSWRAGRYVGELRQGDRVLEIRPRLGIDTIAAWASAALNLRVVPDTAAHTGTSTLIVELTAAIWRSAVIEAARHGPPGLRIERRHQGVAARGRLDVAATLRLRAERTPHLASIERAKNVDNPISRTIILAERVLDSKLHRRPGWRGDRLTEVLPQLRAATGSRPTLPSRSELDRVRYTPITLPYRRAAELSWSIAHNRGPRAQATNDRTEGLLIDVAELWELFLLHCARRATADRVTHGTHLMATQPLLRSASDPTVTLGRLYPDLLIGEPSAPRVIIDAKYKPLADPRGVDREDLYQLTGYLTAHGHGRTLAAGALAYPLFNEQAAHSYAERRGPWRTPQGHPVNFKRLPITQHACVDALIGLIGDAYAG
jgi:5-methylcytosine-specific restriction enzyme subunit McrC